MIQSENKQVKIPTLSNAIKNPIELRESNTTPHIKSTSFIYLLMSGVVISLSMLILIVASVKMWRPKLFPEIQTIHLLKQDIHALKQTIRDLRNDTKSKEMLITEIGSLKQEVDTFKTNMQAEIAVINNNINTLNNKTVETLNSKTSTDTNTEISQDANVFYAQFLAAIEEGKPLLKFYEHAEKINLSNDFKDIMTTLRTINVEKIKSREELITAFDQMQHNILKETMLTSAAQKNENSIIKNITDNIQIKSNQQPNRAQLKKDLIKAKQMVDQDDVNRAIDILKSYAHHQDVDLWMTHAKEKTAYDKAIQNVRNFKGPYNQ